MFIFDKDDYTIGTETSKIQANYSFLKNINDLHNQIFLLFLLQAEIKVKRINAFKGF